MYLYIYIYTYIYIHTSLQQEAEICPAAEDVSWSIQEALHSQTVSMISGWYDEAFSCPVRVYTCVYVRVHVCMCACVQVMQTRALVCIAVLAMYAAAIALPAIPHRADTILFSSVSYLSHSLSLQAHDVSCLTLSLCLFIFSSLTFV